MAHTPSNSHIQSPFSSWQFWLINVTAALYLLDTFLQWLVFKSVFESITSLLLFGILSFEAYSQVKHNKTYFGEKYVAIFCIALLALLVFIYMPKL